MARKTADDAPRGLFERPAGSGVWWVLYYDREGRRHREKVGSKSAALEVYQQRKTEIRLHKFDPEEVTRRRVLTVAGLVDRYRPEFSQKRSAQDDLRYSRIWAEVLGRVPVDQVKPEDVERWRRKRLSEPTRRGRPASPATVNRTVAFLKRLFNLGIRVDGGRASSLRWRVQSDWLLSSTAPSSRAWQTPRTRSCSPACDYRPSSRFTSSQGGKRVNPLGLAIRLG